jgi:peptidoglycan/LPS O-acetylase OafA/YrhL
MTPSRESRLPYMPGIDALRAIAVLAVFFYHVGAEWIPGGFLGVDVFFVISGYLITALLLGEFRRAGHIDVVAFWLRRARRLLPAVAVMIAVTLIFAALLTPGDLDRLRGDALASLLYVNNWHLVFTHQSYFQEFGRPSLLRNLWSLSVEEQFYLLWPLLFAAGMTLFGRKRLLVGALAGVALSALLMALLFDPGGSTNRVFYGTDTRAVGLMIGVALALVWHPSDLRMGTGRRAGWWLDAIGVVALVMIVRSLLTVHDFEPSLYRGGFLQVAFWTGLLVAILAHPAARLGRTLGHPSLVWLGLRSYSFYLWHWPLLMLTRPHLDVPLSGPLLVVLQLAGTLVLADLSYRYVEQPFRHRRDSASAPRWLGVGRPALAGAVLATVFLVGWGSLVSTRGGDVERADANPARVVTSGFQGAGAAHRLGMLGVVGVVDRIRGVPVKPLVRSTPKPPILAIGDSVMRGAAPGLARKLGNVVVDTHEGRQAAEYPPIVDQYRRERRLPQRVVIQVGNNGPLYTKEIDALRAALTGVAHIYLVNVAVPRSWQGEVNGELENAVKSWPQARLVDWRSKFRADETYDGIHLTPAGQAAYIELIASAVRGGG